MTATIKVPDAAAPLDIRIDLRARRVLTSATVDAPKEGRPLSRINWLLRQLKDAPSDLRLEVAFANTRETTSLLLRDAREEPKRLLSPSDPNDHRGPSSSRQAGRLAPSAERAAGHSSRTHARRSLRSIARSCRA